MIPAANARPSRLMPMHGATSSRGLRPSSGNGWRNRLENEGSAVRDGFLIHKPVSNNGCVQPSPTSPGPLHG
jgi:hypothetical protein